MYDGTLIKLLSNINAVLLNLYYLEKNNMKYGYTVFQWSTLGILLTISNFATAC